MKRNLQYHMQHNQKSLPLGVGVVDAVEVAEVEEDAVDEEVKVKELASPSQ